MNKFVEREQRLEVAKQLFEKLDIVHYDDEQLEDLSNEIYRRHTRHYADFWIIITGDPDFSYKVENGEVTKESWNNVNGFCVLVDIGVL